MVSAPKKSPYSYGSLKLEIFGEKLCFRMSSAKMLCMAARAPAKTTRRKPNAAFSKPVKPHPKLEAIVGSEPLSRTEIVSKIWVYIKKHGLQDKNVKTRINTDEVLKIAFDGKTSITMFELNTLASGEHVKVW